MSNLTLEAIELTRLFGGREAVKNVSFHLEKGEVLGFMAQANPLPCECSRAI
jgi:ABC-2 type transport system ATP-binding protein